MPLSTCGRPPTWKVNDSLGPLRGSPVFSAGMPAGFATAMLACAGASGSRPYRPATIGRVEGLTAQVKRPFRLRSELVTVSVKVSGGVVVPSGCTTGEVWPVVVRDSWRSQPRGATPRSVLWKAGSRVARAISRYDARLPPWPAPAVSPSPRYSFTTPCSNGGWNSSGPISKVKP